MTTQKSIDQAALAAVLARHLRMPVSWEIEPGVTCRVGAEGLARRIADRYADEFRPGPRGPAHRPAPAVAPETEAEKRLAWGDR